MAVRYRETTAEPWHLLNSGPRGKSAYEVAVDSGFVGTEQEWLDSIVIPGPGNELSIGTVTTGLPGTPADATITGTSPTQELSLTIPAGETGDPGFTVSDTAPSTAGVWIESVEPADAVIMESTLAPSISSVLVAGSNVTVAYNASTGKITLSSTGGTGGTGEVADGSITDIKIAANANIDPLKIAGTAIINTDPRLTNARTPTAHKSTHAVGGSDVLTKSDIGLGNIDNTSDLNKPISTATQTALNLKAPLASPTFTGTVSGITKAMVGLGNVDNTSDANKPISTATQTALNATQKIVTTYVSAPAAATETINLNYAIATADPDLKVVSVNGTPKSWSNEWGALRGISPYSWGDALVRAIRQTGDGITAGNAFEIEDRRSGTVVMYGRRWADGRLVRNDNVMADTFVVANGATAPASLPEGTVIVELDT